MLRLGVGRHGIGSWWFISCVALSKFPFQGLHGLIGEVMIEVSSSWKVVPAHGHSELSVFCLRFKKKKYRPNSFCSELRELPKAASSVFSWPFLVSLLPL